MGPTSIQVFNQQILINTTLTLIIVPKLHKNGKKEHQHVRVCIEKIKVIQFFSTHTHL
jgi:hypothetical protein